MWGNLLKFLGLRVDKEEALPDPGLEIAPLEPEQPRQPGSPQDVDVSQEVSEDSETEKLQEETKEDLEKYSQMEEDHDPLTCFKFEEPWYFVELGHECCGVKRPHEGHGEDDPETRKVARVDPELSSQDSEPESTPEGEI